MASRRSPIWSYLLKLAVSGVLVWVLVRNRDLAGLAREMLAVEPAALLTAAAGLFLLLVPQAFRWSVVLAAMGHRRGIRICLPLTMIGLFFSQTLPTSIGGDGMRAWELHREGVAMSTAVTSVLIDRAAGLLGICLLVTCTLPLLWGLVPNSAVQSGVLLLVAAGYFGIAIALLLDRLPEGLRRFRLVRGIAALSISLRAVILEPRAALGAVGTSLVYQFGIVWVVFVLARGIHLPVTPADCLVIVPVANLSALLPISISGWGVREGAFVAGFGLVGIAPADAIALSVLSGLLAMLVGVTGGVVWLARRRTGQRAAAL
jgi:glycosyltransferase 2 family protein